MARVLQIGPEVSRVRLLPNRRCVVLSAVRVQNAPLEFEATSVLKTYVRMYEPAAS